MDRRLLLPIVMSFALAASACSTGTSTTSDGPTTTNPVGTTAASTSTTAPPPSTTRPVSTTTSAPPTTTTTTTAPSTTAGPTTTGPAVDPIGSFTGLPVQSDGFPTAPGPTALLTDLRHAPHDGFERIVFEFRDGSDLAYRVESVEAAVPPSGDPIAVAGEVIVQVVMTPASGYDASGGSLEQVYTGPDRISPADSDVIAEMVLVEDFEATLVWAIGLRARHQMAVGVLQDPLRLVVDVATG